MKGGLNAAGNNEIICKPGKQGQSTLVTSTLDATLKWPNPVTTYERLLGLALRFSHTPNN
jgi:hypothetical protein